MDDPNITMEEYIKLEEEKAQKRGKVFNWETAQADPAPVQAPQPPPPPSAAGPRRKEIDNVGGESTIPIRHIHQGRYGVSVPALTKDHKGKKINTPYPEEVNIVCEYSGRYQTWSLLQETPIRRVVQCDLCELSGLSNVLNIILSQRGSLAGIHGLFSGWYCGLASRKVTLGVSMAWAKGITTGTLVRYETSRGRLLGTRAWVNRGSRKIRIPVDMYPCRVEERLTIKLVKGEEVLKIETTVTANDVTITKFLGKLPGYKPTKEEEEISKLKAIYEDVIYDISDSDFDLESTARSGPRNSEMEDTSSSGMRINA
ncbi:hypothetical protein Tco_0681734 [Tanacetum coccineum]|uniref:Uncharacterized protein n=1 Tax=Tanacetum coccineum TaxID=301880 RepID=A0ABQ4XPA3_9ASTR